jgi:hypothetical protein
MFGYPELQGHTFERVRLEKVSDYWLAQFAVDNKLYPPFFEPHHNVADLNEDQFLQHMQAQALTMQEYIEQKAAQA